MNDSIKREQSEFACSADRENLLPKGKKIINPWRNHEGYNCFGCSPDNPIGLHMEFFAEQSGRAERYEDGDYIVSTWHPRNSLARYWQECDGMAVGCVEVRSLGRINIKYI